MIELEKGDEPEVLRKRADEWTRQLLELLENGESVPPHIWRRYAHEDIKRQLKRDSWGKCIYCESRVEHVSFLHIEHIAPKSKFPRRTFVWRNLGLACSRCNNCKGDSYSEDTPPINPYEEDPVEFLIAAGELIWPQPGNDRALLTHSLLKLNRADLLEARRRRLETIRSLAENASRAPNPDVREAFIQQLCEELRDEGEYLFVARRAARLLGFECDNE